MIEYKIDSKISVAEFREILIKSTLGKRRPIDNSDQLAKMLEYGNLTITARENGILVGISRSLTDFMFCTYLSDLAVDKTYQNQGIGKELIRQTKLNAPNAKLILLAAPEALQYYPKIGMTQYEFCYYLDDINKLKK